MDGCNQTEKSYLRALLNAYITKKVDVFFLSNCTSVAISSYAKICTSFANILFITEVALISINNV